LTTVGKNGGFTDKKYFLGASFDLIGLKFGHLATVGIISFLELRSHKPFAFDCPASDGKHTKS
jgi:hypothetical protein